MIAKHVVVIAASRGGVPVLRTLAAGLPADLDAAVCVVMHIGRHKSVLPELMARSGLLQAIHARDGEPLCAGRIYVAPTDRHLVIETQAQRVSLRLSDSAPENFSRPAADPLFRSASMVYEGCVTGVVLSGDLDDGAAGLAMIRARGGRCIVQNPADCEAASMPKAALRAVGAAAAVVEVSELAAAIVEAVRAGPCEERAMGGNWKIEEEARLAARGLVSPDELDGIARRSALTCPECGGTLWRIDNGQPHRYRCHTGHAFSDLSLEEGIAREVERALWSAARTVKERALFARERREWAVREGDAALVEIEDARIAETEALETILREALSEADADGKSAD